MDVYRKAIPAQQNLFRFILFISFFPLLVQGPICRYGDLSKTLYGKHSYSQKSVSYGVQRILWGYFKKLVIADRVGIAVSILLDKYHALDGAYVLITMLLYTLELYADFSGGIDITIGIAETLGITVRENFMRPFFAGSLKERWRRWHISMSTWFRDYFFYPLSASLPLVKLVTLTKKHFGRRAGQRISVYVSTFFVWLATGLWHGAGWNYIVWGLINWGILMISEELKPLYDRFHRKCAFSNSVAYRIFMALRTSFLVCTLNLFECSSSLTDALQRFASLVTARNWFILWDGSLMNLGLTYMDFIIIATGVFVMLCVSLLQRNGSVRVQISQRPYIIRYLIWFGLFLIILLMGNYGVGYNESQFIYNRF